jgi:hypothetical protein
LGVWDLIYEHISYFTPSSLRWLFEDAGFDILNLGTTYGGQYLYVEARLPQHSHASATGAKSVAAISQMDIATANSFADCFHAKLRLFQSWAKDAGAAIERTYVWGAGSKGITFCNLVDPEARLAGLIDRNRDKQGKYVAGTGVGIFRLEDIAPSEISNVVIMNPQYVEEVQMDLRKMGVRANTIDVMEYGA